MPAKPVNIPKIFSIGDKKTLKMFDVKVPFPIIVDVRMQYTEDGVACGINDSQPQIINALYSDREEIIKEMKKDGYYVKSVRQMIFQISELCPLCDRKGTPSIIQKNTDTSYYTVSTSEGVSRTKKEVKGKNKPFWLKYSHKDKPKNCWVQQWQGSISGTFKNKVKTKQIDPRKYFISTAIKQTKNE